MIRSCVFLALFATCGCTPFHGAFQTVDSSLLAPDPQRQPVAAEDVGLFLANDTIPETCERVALLRAVAWVSVVETLREEAGRIGANAVDLRDYRTGLANGREVGESHWDAVALYCPGVGD